MENKQGPTAPHPLLASRWSPASFDTSHGVSMDEVESLVEAARWAEYSEFSLYDRGQAVADMTLQAQSLGLASRQLRAFDQMGLASEFAVPPHWEVSTNGGVRTPRVRPRRSSDAGASTSLA